MGKGGRKYLFISLLETYFLCFFFLFFLIIKVSYTKSIRFKKKRMGIILHFKKLNIAEKKERKEGRKLIVTSNKRTFFQIIKKCSRCRCMIDTENNTVIIILLLFFFFCISVLLSPSFISFLLHLFLVSTQNYVYYINFLIFLPLLFQSLYPSSFVLNHNLQFFIYVTTSFFVSRSSYSF